MHGRTKEENRQFVVESNWSAIKKIKSVMNIPVIANGGLEEYGKVKK